MDARTEGLDARENAKRNARGTKRKDKDDGATITLKPLKDGLRNLGKLASKVANAKIELKEAINAIAEKTGLNVSTVSRLVKAHAGDRGHFDDEKRKVEQLGICFEEIGYEGEITKETTPAPGSDTQQ